VELYVQSLQAWLLTTSVSRYINGEWWAWPISESLHFIGLCLLFGIVGLYDLRLIGFLKRLPLSELHRLIPFGVAGYGINLLSGLTFISGAPDQYVHNPAFHMKVLFMAGAGINMLIFYLLTYKLVKDIGAEQNAPFQARLAGAVSLVCWTGVIVCGRYLTFFRPPARWCFWC
jgi:hypothetical protein